ncbi:putative telomere-binding protein (plasmid) [Rhodococcus sp. WAY2]|nr:putative telomere-binding protein [Rhodococcus sp. WAY2]
MVRSGSNEVSGGPEQFALFELSSETSPLDPQAPENPGRDSNDDPGEPLAESDAVSSAGPDEPEPDESTADDTTPDSRPPWESLPVGAEADEHALIVTADGTYTPSGRELTGPVDSVEKLDKLIRWASLTPLGAPAQIWVVGQAACELLGWIIDPGSEDDVDDMEALRNRAAQELTAVLHATLTPMLNAGWELRGDPGHVVHLSRSIGNFTSMVDVVIEPYVWTYWNKDFGWHNRVGDMGILGSPTAGTYLPDDDLPAARELGRRLAWCAQHLGVLPGPTPARTGAALVDKIKRERTRSGKGIVVTTPGSVPPLDGGPRGDLEPAVGWTRVPDAQDVDGVSRLVSIDQRAAYLASAGMLEFGYGQPTHLTGGAAAAAAVGEKGAPFGLWRITLPPGQALSLPEKLPLPHPHMLADQPVQTWVTTVSLDGLCSPVADGGIGADLDDLDITEAWVYPQQGRALDKWAKILREARKAAVDTEDDATKRFLGTCYKGYIGRMVNPDMWTAKQMQHHHQPVWRAAIIAHCRWRGRRVAMRIAREHGRWPVRTVTDSWVYLLSGGEDIADPSEALGKMSVEKDVVLADTLLTAFTSAQDVHDVNLAIKAAFADNEDTDDEGEGVL